MEDLSELGKEIILLLVFEEEFNKLIVETTEPNKHAVKDELRYLNGTIYLQFDKIQEVGGFTYQSFIKGSWNKEGV